MMSTPKVEYGYANGSANTIRPTSLTYPDGRVISYGYGTSGGMDDASSRIAAMVDDDVGSTHLAEYSYLGSRMFVEVDYTQPDVKYTPVDLSGSSDPNTGNIYSGFDRFGRIKDSRWYDYGSSADADRFKYGYDRASNRLWRENTVAVSQSKDFDELYAYDGLYRLIDMQRGRLNAQKNAITNKTFAQDWSLDPTGNWSSLREDDDGDGTWDLNQSRTNNKVNEITNITETTGPAWVTPAYDAAGNMTTVPQPADPTASYSATYDAWNRLVELVDAGTSNTVAQYEYDGVRRRVVKKTYTGGSLDETRHVFFTRQWQAIEERVDSDTDPNRQFVWGLRYVDDCMVRDRDTDGNGTLDERLYGLQDTNWNVTAVVDESGAVQERYAYQAYGMPFFLSASFAGRASSSFAWDRLFAGYRWDAGIGLYQVRNRVLNPILGAWLQRDPLRYADSRNLYEYAIGKPVRRTDPFGRQSSGAHPPGTIIVIPPNGEPREFPPGTSDSVVEDYINGHPGSTVIEIGPSGKPPHPPEELEPHLPQPAPPPEPPEPPNCEDLCRQEFGSCWTRATVAFMLCAAASSESGGIGFIACVFGYQVMVDDCRSEALECLEDCEEQCEEENGADNGN